MSSSSATEQNVHATLGSVLLGNVVSVFLSGIVTMQVLIYYRLYPKDLTRIKLIVGTIWLIDTTHAVMVTMSNWSYLIENFGNTAISDKIFWSLAVTIALTATLTFFVHCFFCHRILTLSRYNYYITAPIFILALARLAFACVTTSRMIMLGSFKEFTRVSSFIFTSGLSLATAVDFLIAAALIWYLNKNRTGFSAMDTVIDSITLYTVESGLLTSIVTVISLIFWLCMSHNLVFLALHFAISKLYANAFLATLNARRSLRGRSQGSSRAPDDHAMPVLFPASFNRLSRLGPHTANHDGVITTKVQINVEKTIDIDGSTDEPYSPTRSRGGVTKTNPSV
ncbi:hypothetical protein BXZ70DRAFT_1008862 [Cristinia sonorae]|uniref:DUF6534 domain-containing protein n=1 Tax=Cristinia sonorae TaxID=1940300 RepID=A0A8K0XP99_9AGAR|nr:hypothetical protein BXZ70DRAFT_1008862 [Cristinia sonorae]